jgi:23S rRNA-/tRNA-specific pseudouridylate synthase
VVRLISLSGARVRHQADWLINDNNVFIFKNDIDRNILRHPIIGFYAKDRIKQAVNEDGKDAITHYRVIDRFGHQYLYLYYQSKPAKCIEKIS